VELEVYSGPYEWLLALILKDELEIFEVPLRELVGLYLQSRIPNAPNALERDSEFAGSAAALILLKSRTLFPDAASPEDLEENPLSPEQLADRLTQYLKVRRGAEALRERLSSNAGHYPSAHAAPPRPGRLEVNRERLIEAARRTFSRLAEPSIGHLGPITLTLQELASVIRAALTAGPVSFEELVKEMDLLNKAVAFAAALSLAQEGSLRLSQTEPLGPLTLKPGA